MSSSKELREQIKKHGLRELCTNPSSQEDFTHLVAADGTEYRLVEGMSDRDLWLAAQAGNHLFVFHTEDSEEMSPIFVTAKVIAFHHEDLSHGHKGLSGDGGPWVQTQNQKYWLLAKAD